MNSSSSTVLWSKLITFSTSPNGETSCVHGWTRFVKDTFQTFTTVVFRCWTKIIFFSYILNLMRIFSFCKGIHWYQTVLSPTYISDIYPLATYTPPHFCTILSFVTNFCTLCIILYSFYAALLRYLFCTYSIWVEKFGKERLIRIVYWVFYVHAFLWALGNKLLHFSLEVAPMINSCYGWSDRVYMLELHDSANMVKRHFCGFDSVDGMRNICVN